MFDTINKRNAVSGRSVTRRTLLMAGAGIGATLAAPGIWRGARADSGLTVTCWGGKYRDGIDTVFAKPFTEETGIPVTLIDNADLAKMKAQVDSGNVEWDVFDSVGPQIMSGSKQGLWEKIDESIVDRSDLAAPGGEDTVGTYLFGGGIAWDTKRFPDGKHPVDFKGFWVVKGIPGSPGLRPRVSENLEMALIADGVAPHELYPLDVERAFAKMDEIKPAVKTWIEATPQTVTLVANGEIDFSYSYISRIRPVQLDGSTLNISMEQTLNSLEYQAVSKGTKNREAAMRYIAFCLRPDRQAAIAEKLYFTPNSMKGLEVASPDARKYMPDMTKPNNAILDDAWWADNYTELQNRFTEWLLI
ncbi:MAG: ABC transporter substrate-binding protein [Alphaproteobacteria bacterium]|nr:ABC transporter substrate-binding protein [Alphaproteobacteria bacterium]